MLNFIDASVNGKEAEAEFQMLLQDLEDDDQVTSD